MADTEVDAESVVLAAIMGPDADDVEKPEQELELEQNADVDEAVQGGAETSAPQQAKEDSDPAEELIKIAGADGTEREVALKDLVASHREFEALRGRQSEIIVQAEQQAARMVRDRLTVIEQESAQAAAMIAATLQVLQAPRPPNAELMLNPQSQHYDPDGYHRQFAQFQHLHQQFQHAQGLGQQLLQRMETARTEIAATRIDEALASLDAKGGWFSEFAHSNPQDPQGARGRFFSEMQAAYGYSFEELDGSLNSPRDLEVARDALAYRAMKAKSGELRKQVEAAPKITRSKTEARGASAQARDAKGQFVQGSFKRAMQSRSDDDWAGYFADLSRAGRF